jgi:uncharacterized RDD family membrane protein YckC
VTGTRPAPPEGLDPGPAHDPGPDELRLGDPDRRFYAFAIDGLIAWGLGAAVAVVVARTLWSEGRVVLGVAVVASTVLAVGVVFAVLVGTTGRTPGKWLTGLRVVHTGSDGPIGVGPALLRTLVLALAAVPFGSGLVVLAWTALADREGRRRGWHDHLVSSVVLDARPLPVVVQEQHPGPRHAVNLTALRLGAPRHTAGKPSSAAAPARASRPAARQLWGVDFDSGERVVVDTLVLLGRRPEPRTGEQGARLVVLPTADLSVADTHAHVVVAADGALVVTDRDSASGSTLVRQGLRKPLAPGRPTTLLAGDVVILGDRTMTVTCLSRPVG